MPPITLAAEAGSQTPSSAVQARESPVSSMFAADKLLIGGTLTLGTATDAIRGMLGGCW
ncbi:hypothetical protein HAX39_24785 [Citrobacter freundii]|nr:hypothetical protein [Citrobacter freundii]